MNCCKVLEYIREQEVVDFLQKLIKIPSVYEPRKPGMNEEKVALFVADYLKKMDFEVVVEEVSPGRPNVIAIIEGHKPGKTILLEAHTEPLF
jgi:succinyl-diaminopimelate desuccinylase